MAASAMVRQADPEATTPAAVEDETVARRHRILIAAAVAAVMGSARITDIRPAAWTRRRPAGVRMSPTVRRQTSPAETEPEEEETGGVMKLLITLENKKYEVEVEILPSASVEPSDGENGVSIPDSVLLPPRLSDIRDADRICRSPIAGAVVSVEVEVGMRVRQDDPIAIIDAMKMETVVGAPVDGVVAEVEIMPGDAIKTGQVLCRLS